MNQQVQLPRCTALGEHERGRFADSAARARDDDDLAFDSQHKILLYRSTISIERMLIARSSPHMGRIGSGQKPTPSA
jgi:hypothetical protein